MLRGLGDPLQTAIARQGLRVRTYCPVGDLVAGMAYLVRRLLENTSNDSFLHEQARGRGARRAAGEAARRREPPERRAIVPHVKPFANEPILELRRGARARAAGRRAREPTTRAGRCKVPVWIGDDRREGSDIVSTDPGNARPRRGRGGGGAARTRSTPRSPRRGRGTRPASERAEVLMRAAQWLRERRLEVAALAVRECAKPWPEADADVCEAIDFLEYYARGAVDLAQGAPLLQPPGERNELRWDRARHRRGHLAVELPGGDRAAG